MPNTIPIEPDQSPTDDFRARLARYLDCSIDDLSIPKVNYVLPAPVFHFTGRSPKRIREILERIKAVHEEQSHADE